MNSSLSRCPIEDILPWTQSLETGGTTIKGSDGGGNSVLVTDCVETSGRFLLFATAAAAFRKRNRVLWISCNGAYCINHVCQGLKKIGCVLSAADALHGPATPISKFSDVSNRISIWSTASEMIELITSATAPGGAEKEAFIQSLYYNIQNWMQAAAEETSVIILDDVSTLADVVGSSLAYALVYELVKLSNSLQQTLLVRCAGDNLQTTMEAQQGCIGASGTGPVTLGSNAWEPTLVELFQWIADVLPLQSGYTREAHGHLCLTPRPTGIGKTHNVPLRFNYCCTDQAVFAIRLTPNKVL
jgi:hypothetical protein